jgi:hypothetical protein
MNATATPVINAPIVPPFASMFAKAEQVGPPKCILLYGAPGTFKTSIAGGAIKLPGVTKMLYIDVDNGSEVFANDQDGIFRHVNEHNMGLPGEKTINIVRIDKTASDAFGQLKYFLGYRDAVTGTFVRGAAFDQGYDTIAIDAFDVAQEIAVQWLLSNTFNEKEKVDTRGAWGEVSKWTSDVAWALQNSKELGIIVAHSTEGTDEGGQFKIKAKLQGSVKDSIAGIPSIVAHLDFVADPQTKEAKLVATVGQSDIHTTKNRYMLPKEIIDFDLPKLYATIADRRANNTAATAAE